MTLMEINRKSNVIRSYGPYSITRERAFVTSVSSDAKGKIFCSQAGQGGAHCSRQVSWVVEAKRGCGGSERLLQRAAAFRTVSRNRRN